jgi:hypothetical protein
MGSPDNEERDMSKYTLTRDGAQAHTVTGGRVVVPDEVALDQEAFDGATFPVLRLHINGVPRKCRARLRGDLYGLHTPGTGDMVVSIV